MSNATAETTMTPTQAEAVRDAGLFTLGTARWLMSKLIEGLTPEQWIHQACDGVNHALWNVGHIAASEKFFLQCAGGSTASVPDSYEGLFGMGSQPSSSMDAYPSPGEVVEVFNRVREECIAHMQGLSGEQLLVAVDNERMQGVAPTVVQLINFMVLHDATHIGQILVARKALGLPGVLGS